MFIYKQVHQCYISSKILPYQKYCDVQILISHWIYISIPGQHKFRINWNISLKQTSHLQAADNIEKAIELAVLER